MTRHRPWAARLLAGALCVLALGAATPAPAADHPFLLWTPEEAAALRETIETEAWAREAYEALPKGGDEALPNLVRYGVMGDAAAGEAEKQALLKGKGGRLAQAFRYDVLYDLLSPEERSRVEKRFRDEVRGAVKRMAHNPYTRINWLPNITYVWYRDLHVVALVLRDKTLVREIFESPFGFKWYLDDYLCDLGFYNEEFGKQFVRAGALMLWMRGADRLGWTEMGSGYTGEGGATMRGYVESLLRIGMPAVDLGTTRPHIPRLTMGDAKGARGMPAYGFQHHLAPGWLVDRPAGRVSEYHGGHLPQWVWFEIAHKKWPDAGFGYILAARRAPDERRYHPTLYFGLDPVDPERVAAPPGVSGVYPERGLVVLRAEEGPDYWTSAAPAVGMRLATPYAHHIQDCFCLTGFYAHNRPIFVNRQMSTNYSGVDPSYSNSLRSHSGVMVDFADPKTVGVVPTRHHFGAGAKFASGRGSGIFDGVDQTRALVLTRDYLLDASHLVSDRPRHYEWFVQAMGHACPGEPDAWTPSQDLAGSLFDVRRERSLETDETWSVTSVQTSGGAHRAYSGFGPRWFERRVGVRTEMLGEPGTTAYHAWAPVVADASGRWWSRDRFAYGEDEPAAVLVAAIRKAPATMFVALHEPFDGKRRLRGMREVARTDDAVAVCIEAAGGAWRDYVLLRFGDKQDEPVTLGPPTERFTFTGYAWCRVGQNGVQAEGDLGVCQVFLGDAPGNLTLDGAAKAAAVREGYLVYPEGADWPAPDGAARKADPAAHPSEPEPGPIAVWWSRPVALGVPAGGTGTATLHLRNEGLVPVSGRLRLEGSDGLRVRPRDVAVDAFPPGGERAIEVTVDAAGAPFSELLRVTVSAGDTGAPVQREALRVANGVCVEHTQLHLGDPCKTIYAPTYVARYYYMDSSAAALLLDGDGFRRSDASSNTLPTLLRYGTDSRGREGWQEHRARKFPYFVPVVVPGEEGAPPLVYEAGRHAHGTTGGLEHWFAEDWIVCRFRDAEDGERIAFDWHPPSRKNALPDAIAGRREDLMRETAPGAVLVATPDGKVIDATEIDSRGRLEMRLPKGVGPEVAAVFRRPHGYRLGEATLYPAGARVEKRLVTHPGPAPVGFTFCTAERFPALVTRWLADVPTGEARPIERGTYNGAFMPHLEAPKAPRAPH